MWLLLRRLELVCQIMPGDRRWKRLAIRAIERDRFVDNVANFIEYGAFVVAVTASEQKARRAPDIGLVFFRSFNDFDVLGAGVHA
jgi:hypothetical protein